MKTAFRNRRHFLHQSRLLHAVFVLCFMMYFTSQEGIFPTWKGYFSRNSPKIKFLKHNCAKRETLDEYCSSALGCNNDSRRLISTDLTILEAATFNASVSRSTLENNLTYLSSTVFLEFQALHQKANFSVLMYVLDDFTHFIRTPIYDTVEYPRNDPNYAYLLPFPVVHETQITSAPFAASDNPTYVIGKVQPYLAGFLVLRNAVAHSSDGNVLVQTCSRAVTVIGCSKRDVHRRLRSRLSSIIDGSSKCLIDETDLRITIVSFKKLVILGHTWYEAFYHFTIEAMSRLMQVYDLILLDPDVSILLKYPIYESNAKQLLHLLGIDQSRIFFYSDQPEKPILFKAEIMIVPRGVACGGAPPSLLEQIRLRVINGALKKKVTIQPYYSLELPIVRVTSRNTTRRLQSHFKLATGPLVIISRKKNPKRRIINEMDIIKHVYEKYPMVPVSIFEENMPLGDTIKLFQSARAVIAPHGAGLSHILWMRSGTAVLEVFPINKYNGCYQTMAQYRRIQGFVYFSAETSIGSSTIVNMTILGQLIEQMMQGRY